MYPLLIEGRTWDYLLQSRMDAEAECYRTLETDGCRSRGMVGSHRTVPTEATCSCISSTVWDTLHRICRVSRSTKSPSSDVGTNSQTARLLSGTKFSSQLVCSSIIFLMLISW
jgi:hypothetical protein